MSLQNDPTTHATLTWDEHGQPLSTSFGDVYFSKANGLEETRHVFLQHNQLAQRWATLAATSHFTIAETGFGSGLNFLAARDLWLRFAPKTAQLHFVSVEKYPLLKSDLARALALWPELAQFANQLVEAYPVIVGPGFHRLKFIDGRINLTLIIDDAAAGFEKLLASPHPLFARTGVKVDAWFLDGFAPAKNPAMWSDQLFANISKLSDADTTAATFSAAAIVKNGLQAAGFSIEKVAGFGRKREMVKARFAQTPVAPQPEDFINNRSFSPYPPAWAVNPNPPHTNKSLLVIGGGLAGCHTARSLAERGWQVRILDRQAQLAQEGSGNPQGVLYAKLSPLDEPQAAFNLAALQYAMHFYQPLWNRIGNRCGVLQLAYKAAEARLHEHLRSRYENAEGLVQFLNAEEASNLAAIPLAHGGLYFPQAGWIDPRKLCAYLVDHANISVQYDTEVTALYTRDQAWVAETNRGEYLAPVVVIASACNATNLEPAKHLPVKAIRGQVSFIPQTHASPSLAKVVCAEGYIAPAQEGQFCTGATFNLQDASTELRMEDQQTNLDNLADYAPAFRQQLANLPLAGRVGFRCTLPDYLPVVGPLPDIEKMQSDFALLRKNARAGIAASGTYLKGLYINIGFGARGLAYTPICAELLAAHINNEPIPMPRELANALNPARFVIRDLIRNKI